MQNHCFVPDTETIKGPSTLRSVFDVQLSAVVQRVCWQVFFQLPLERILLATRHYGNVQLIMPTEEALAEVASDILAGQYRLKLSLEM